MQSISDPICWSFKTLIILILSSLLMGCGQSGPLYLPGNPPPITVIEEETNTECIATHTNSP